MKNKEFAILQNISTGQFLVNTTFDHDTNEFELSAKFWSEKINGYVTITNKWTQDNEKYFIETFEKFKDIKFCEKWVKLI